MSGGNGNNSGGSNSGAGGQGNNGNPKSLSNQKGPGMGGAGSGDGGQAPEKDSEYIETETKLRSQLQPGEIVNMYRQRGTPPSGKAMKKLNRVFDHSRQEAQDAMNDQGVSPGARDFVKEYYDKMREQLNSAEESSESSGND